MSEMDRRAAALRDESWWEQYRRQYRNADDHQLRLFVRSLAPASSHDQRTRRLERIERITEKGVLDAYDVELFGREICICTACQQLAANRERADRLLELASWHSNGLQSAGFSERTVDSSLTGDQYRTLVPPETSVGIYLDGSLEGVFPSQHGNTHYTVDSYLQVVATASETPATPENWERQS